MKRGRTWRWLRLHIAGLLSVPPALVSHTFYSDDGKRSTSRLVRVPQTRLGLTLDPPNLDPPR